MPRGTHVVGRGQDRAGLPVEHGQELRPGQDVAAGVAVVGVRVADDLTGARPRRVGRLHGDLGPTVAVVVVHLELGVVGAGPDVAAEVDAPQPRAVEPVRVDEDVAGVAGLRVVLGVGRVPLQDDLELPVAVEVAHAGVVGRVRVGDAVRRGAAARHLDRHVEEAVAELQRRLRRRLLRAVDDRADGVRGAGRGTGVEQVGRVGDRRGVHPGRSAVHIERHAGRVRAQQPPADVVARPGTHADQPAVEPLHLLGVARRWGRGGRRWCRRRCRTRDSRCSPGRWRWSG